MATRANRLLTSNCHAFFACLFDLYGRVQVELDAEGDIGRLLLSIDGVERTYLPQLQKLYGGTSSKGAWTVEWEQAEAFAKAVKFFVPRRRRELDLFLDACWLARTEPLTKAQQQRRAKTLKKLKAIRPRFELPPNFVKGSLGRGPS
jgi:hypothetical protein